MMDVFEEMKLGFLIVGHTHEDIDGCFGYLLKRLIEKYNYVLVDLMRASMVLPRMIVYSSIDSRDFRF
jgi:hypothetical protein